MYMYNSKSLHTDICHSRNESASWGTPFLFLVITQWSDDKQNTNCSINKWNQKPKRSSRLRVSRVLNNTLILLSEESKGIDQIVSRCDSSRDDHPTPPSRGTGERASATNIDILGGSDEAT